MASLSHLLASSLFPSSFQQRSPPRISSYRTPSMNLSVVSSATPCRIHSIHSCRAQGEITFGIVREMSSKEAAG
ncbi:hypothetical protein P154DRAFT_524746 [Amniculicola lignicola CBS 123094]|uniref:Uncharacterized protein n=1 Tax=Amniculicola lignicola CBS 123094 TaxID=1392246 RepID=A0A6A5W9S5_9PLEO|nr:hypothetical protein P154DRAFT_524746 [Amniculicola lignicola CBS 123094]